MKSEKKLDLIFCPYKEVVIERVSSELLEKIGALFALKKIEHQYPHCWRCHKPVIFRILQTASVCKPGSSVMQQKN